MKILFMCVVIRVSQEESIVGIHILSLSLCQIINLQIVSPMHLNIFRVSNKGNVTRK